uniref:Uncharacterized protein n=1 Tax=Cucumis melo TaxID=3656 RepID=A0A9I9DCY9_CUCME
MFDGKEKCRRWVFLQLKKMKERGREREMEKAREMESGRRDG